MFYLFECYVNISKQANYIEIAGRKIGTEYPPYIIAELSANHNGQLERALAVIDMAKRCGVDAVKLQTYTQDTLTIDCDRSEFQIKSGLWKGRTLYDLYKEAHMPWDWHKSLYEKARDLDMTIFSSPFDSTAVDLLEDLNTPAYKIASFEAIDLPLIAYVASTGKPMIISTGMANEDEISEAVITARDHGCKEVAVLHCVSGYPAPASDYNLKTITDMKQKYNCVVGISDHTIDNLTAIASIPLGASIIEKHVTLDRNGGGPDDSFSLEESDLSSLCQSSKTVWNALGRVNYERKSSEKDNLVFRRSLYVVADIKQGERITENNVRSIRPGYGLPPKFLSEVLGKTANKAISRGTALSMDDINQ